MSNTFKTIRVDTSADDNLNHSRFSNGLSVFLNWLDFESSTALIWENKTKPFDSYDFNVCKGSKCSKQILINSNFVFA